MCPRRLLFFRTHDHISTAENVSCFLCRSCHRLNVRLSPGVFWNPSIAFSATKKERKKRSPCLRCDKAIWPVVKDRRKATTLTCRRSPYRVLIHGPPQTVSVGARRQLRRVRRLPGGVTQCQSRNQHPR